MKQRFAFIFIFYAIISWFFTPFSLATVEKTQVLVLCYHDIPKEIKEDAFAVDRETFINTIEYLKAHQFHFVSVDDIFAAHQGKRTLPPKSVLLTFDDAYYSYYEFVVPVLEQYQIPSLLAVETSWITKKPLDITNNLMSWSEIEEVSRSPLVEIATHTDKLHRGIIYNPQGNDAASATSLQYDAKKKTYENQSHLRKRVREDLALSKKILESHIHKTVRVVVWPYGQYSAMTVEEAEKLGLKLGFTLNDGRPYWDEWNQMGRFLIYKNPTIRELLRELRILPVPIEQKRAVQIDVDLIYDKDPAQTERNLGALLDRLKAMKVSTVYVQAFADPDGDGNVDAVYFPNRVLPMRADLFSRVVHQLKTRVEVEVYAWMPMLSIVLPDEEKNKALAVREFKGKKITPSREDYQRLSPFSPEAKEILVKLYEDMAAHSSIDGVIFQDDGYLTDFEDFHPSALKRYKAITGGEIKKPVLLSDKQMQVWTGVKTQQLINLSEDLMKAVLNYRPEAKFARTLYACVLDHPVSEEWFAQNYKQSLSVYDYVVIMAYPRMENVRRVKPWFEKIVSYAKRYPKAMEKTVFKVQAFDWKRRRWIKAKTLNRWLDYLVAAGARHVAYYPDDYTIDRPQAGIIRRTMSVEDFPFYWEKKVRHRDSELKKTQHGYY